MSSSLSHCVIKLHEEHHDLEDYQGGVPRWCNGCGDNAILAAMQRLCSEEELAPENTVFQQRLETGLQYSPMRNFDLRLTAAASHTNHDDRSNDPNLALLGLDNQSGDDRGHWDYPAELGAVWHF